MIQGSYSKGVWIDFAYLTWDEAMEWASRSGYPVREIEDSGLVSREFWPRASESILK